MIAVVVRPKRGDTPGHFGTKTTEMFAQSLIQQLE
jgi:hypothetical protein